MADMSKYRDLVLDGLYKGGEIKPSRKTNLIYIDYEGNKIYLTKRDVLSIKNVSTSTASADLIGTATVEELFGTAAASAKAAKTYKIVEIVWQNGEKSIANIYSEYLDAIRIAMYADMSDELAKEEETIEEKRQKELEEYEKEREEQEKAWEKQEKAWKEQEKAWKIKEEQEKTRWDALPEKERKKEILLDKIREIGEIFFEIFFKILGFVVIFIFASLFIALIVMVIDFLF